MRNSSKSSESTGNADVDAKRTEFLALTQQLKETYASGDTETANTLKDQLHALKQTFFDMKNQRF